MTAIVFSVKSWVAWNPGEADTDCWRGSLIPEAAPPLMLRRRVSRLGQRVLRAAWAQPDTANALLIFSSRHGEFSRTLSILDSLTAGTEVSPADFSLSVHHALAGLLSIATANRRGHTAVAAGLETLFYALLEGAACRREAPDVPVVIAHYDEPLPEPYDTFGQASEETVALTLCLDREGQALRLSWVSSSAGAVPSANPAGRLIDLLEGTGTSATIVGERLTWTLQRVDSAEKTDAAA